MTEAAQQPAERNGGELVLAVLRAAKVRTVFGVLSIHNLPIIDAISSDPEIRFVPARGEAGAANMADGYARASGEIGVVVSSTGGGAANTAGALLEAHDGASPVLHITGQVDSTYLDTNRTLLHSNPRQRSMLANVGKAATRADRTEDIPAVLAQALRTALCDRPGPTSVEIPIDQQFRAVPSDAVVLEPWTTYGPDDATLTRAIEVLRGARRPLIWAGGGASRVQRGDDETRVTQLAERLGAGVITTNAGRGAIPEDHPLCIGNFSTDDAVVQLLSESDAVLALGTSFRGNETRNWGIPMPADLIQVDRAADRIGCGFPTGIGLVADISPTLAALIEGVAGRDTDASWLEAIEGARAEARARCRSLLGPHSAILDGLRSVLPPEATVVRDVTVAGAVWASKLLETRRPRTAIHSAALAVGQGLSMGIGAAVARPDHPVVVLAGDGGLAMALGEIGTAVQEGIDLVAVVFNDHGYGILRNMQDAFLDGRRFGSDLHMPDFVAMGEAFGCAAARITSAVQTAPEVEAALARGGVTILEVDLAAIGPMAVPFTGTGRLIPERTPAPGA